MLKTPAKALAAAISALSLALSVAATAAPLTVDQAMHLPASKVEASLADSHPSTVYIYAQRLFEEGKKDDAVVWFYVGQLRFRYHLMANPGLPPDGEPAVMASLNATLGQTINEWAGGSPQAWAAAMTKALAWDAAHPNPTTPKAQNAQALEKTRTGLAGLRDQIIHTADQIRAQRKARGLEVR